MHVYIQCVQAAPDKGKTGQKAEHQNKGRKKQMDLSHPWLGEELREQRGVQSPQGAALSELLLNVTK